MAGQQPDEIIDADHFTMTVVAGETIAERDALYIDPSDDEAYLCDADDDNKLGFVGFAEGAATSGQNVRIKTWGIKDGFTGLTPTLPVYVSTTAGGVTQTKPTTGKLIGYAVTSSVIRLTHELSVRTTEYTTVADPRGSSDSQFDITNPSGNTYRYTYDGTGTDPGLTSSNPAVGEWVWIESSSMAAANTGFFEVTGSGTNYFEITNASGTTETNVTLSSGELVVIPSGYAYQKFDGLKYIEVEGQGPGGGGGGSSDTDGSGTGGAGGGGGGGFKVRIDVEDLADAEAIRVGERGGAGASGGGSGGTGDSTVFGTPGNEHGRATSGGGGGGNAAAGGAPGVGTCPNGVVYDGNGGGSSSGGGSEGPNPGAAGGAGALYGGAAEGRNGNATGHAAEPNSGGGGGGSGYNNGSGAAGGAGAHGKIVIHEYF